MPHCPTGDLEPIGRGEGVEKFHVSPAHAHQGFSGKLLGEVVLNGHFKVPLSAQSTVLCFGEEDGLHKVAEWREG